MTTRTAPPELTAFIRRTLGCGCPPEVFEHIADGPTHVSRAAGVRRRIDVGGRLLIYLVEPSDAAQALSSLHGWIAAGKTERDAAAMNRLRLVVALNAPDPEEVERLEGAFAEAARGDERLHLHILDPGACPMDPDAPG
ncbi:hypothetical protein [Imhoffiella purpurea]|uniref:Uncharacterized protein n=1 Tax=Imhoffiella purpurea TaxID=1249627 RepID=W9VD52_9GAMM|nr:hypothetical protein [Imhoffiella purpurea]EXJ13972.1 hypothetical protein D779_3172 [Imhoffiella purpurea]